MYVLPVFPTPGCPIIITLIGFCLGISPILLHSVDVIVSNDNKSPLVDGGCRTAIVMFIKKKTRKKIQGNVKINVKFTDNPFG